MAFKFDPSINHQRESQHSRNTFLHNARVKPLREVEYKYAALCPDAERFTLQNVGILECYCGTQHAIQRGDKCCGPTCKECGSALLWQGAEKFQGSVSDANEV